MASEETSYNQDAHTQPQAHHDGQDQPNRKNFEPQQVVCSNVSDDQQEHLSFNISNCPVYQAEEESDTAVMFLTPPAVLGLAAVSEDLASKELCLQQKLHIQRLQHQRYEEHLEHLIKVKELSHKLSASNEAPEVLRLRHGMLPPTALTAYAPNTAAASASNVAVSDNNSNPSIPIIDQSCSPTEVKLIKKLREQRLQQQIEEEDAIHKLKMKQLLTLT